MSQEGLLHLWRGVNRRRRQMGQGCGRCTGWGFWNRQMGGCCGRCTGSGVLEETGIAGEQAGRESTPGRGPGE